MKMKFKEIDARNHIRVIYMAFFTSKEVNGLQEFGSFRKFLSLIKVSFLNRWVTLFWLAALHLSGQTASNLLRAILMFVSRYVSVTEMTTFCPKMPHLVFGFTLWIFLNAMYLYMLVWRKWPLFVRKRLKFFWTSCI